MKKGDIVKCIDGSANPKLDYKEFNWWICEGHNYKVRRVEILNGTKRILLEDLINKKTYSHTLMGFVEAAYNAKRFILLSEYPKYAQKRIKQGFFMFYNGKV